METQERARRDREPAAGPTRITSRFVSRVSPILFVGDSNVLIHRNVLYRDVPTFSQPVVTQAIYCEQIRAETFTDSDGTLAPGVFYPLLGSLALLGDANDWGHERRRDIVRRHAVDLERFGERWVHDDDNTLLRPVIVFVVGNIDFRRALLELGNDTDFTYESARFGAASFPSRARTSNVPASLVRALVTRMFEPFFAGLRKIREAGVKDIAIHELQPPNLSDEAFAVQLGGVSVDAAFRYKLTLVINDCIERFCRDEEIHFLNIWERVTVGGLLDERYVLDESHLNASAARLTVERLGELLAGSR